MISPLPRPLTDALSTLRPDTRTWVALCRLLDATPDVDLAVVKKALAAWPKELPRAAPRHWLSSGSLTKNALKAGSPYLSLCHDTRENEAHYNLYETAIGMSPLLRCRDGSQAVTMWRQPRGEVTLATGQRMVLGGGQPGLADLGGLMLVELEKPLHRISLPPLADRRGFIFVGDEAVIQVSPAPVYRLQLYVEVEVKIDGCIPNTAAEYRGESKAKLSPTETEQVQRQKAQTARGGFYQFHERTAEAVAALVKYRDDVVRRLS